MAAKRRYEELAAWKKAMDLVDLVNELTKAWPAVEVYGLTSQVRRSVESAPTNIAKGQGRTGIAEFLHHVSIADGSLMEMETLLTVGKRGAFVPNESHGRAMDLSLEVSRLILATMSSLRWARAREYGPAFRPSFSVSRFPSIL